jgi:hypothetical protein
VTGYVWLHEHLDPAPAAVRPIDPYAASFDLTPVTVTVTAGEACSVGAERQGEADSILSTRHDATIETDVESGHLH